MAAMPFKEQCAEKCMDLADAKAPNIYKVECIYRVEQTPNYWYFNEWDLGNYTYNYSNGTFYSAYDPKRVYVTR
jgi:hypothetical protein